MGSFLNQIHQLIYNPQWTLGLLIGLSTVTYLLFISLIRNKILRLNVLTIIILFLMHVTIWFLFIMFNSYFKDKMDSYLWLYLHFMKYGFLCLYLIIIYFLNDDDSILSESGYNTWRDDFIVLFPYPCFIILMFGGHLYYTPSLLQSFLLTLNDSIVVVIFYLLNHILPLPYTLLYCAMFIGHYYVHDISFFPSLFFAILESISFATAFFIIKFFVMSFIKFIWKPIIVPAFWWLMDVLKEGFYEQPTMMRDYEGEMQEQLRREADPVWVANEARERAREAAEAQEFYEWWMEQERKRKKKEELKKKKRLARKKKITEIKIYLTNIIKKIINK